MHADDAYVGAISVRINQKSRLTRQNATTPPRIPFFPPTSYMRPVLALNCRGVCCAGPSLSLQLMQDMWAMVPEARPSAREVAARLEEMRG